MPDSELKRALNAAQACLAVAGGLIVSGRAAAPPEAQELITAMRDAREPMRESHQHRCGDSNAESHLSRARDCCGRGRRECRREHLSLEPDVHHA